MRVVVEIKAPVYLKHLEGKFSIFFKALVDTRRIRREIFDAEKMVTIDLKRGERIALIDRNNNFWELRKDKKGRFSIRRLKGRC